MPDDVTSAAPSTATVETPAALPPETPSADPVKAAIQRGDHAEMNRLMNERKRDRAGIRPDKPIDTAPSTADSAPAQPVTEPAAGAGAQNSQQSTANQVAEPKPGSKEFNFRELETERDRWKTEAQQVGRRIQELERRLAETPVKQEPAKPLDVPFNEPQPDLESILDQSETLEEANRKYAGAMNTWLQKRDAARDKHIQSQTRYALSQEQEHQRLIGIANSIRNKVDALAKTEGFEDLPQLYAESQSPYTDEMLRFYAEDEHGARVMHHMILNPAQAQEITMLPLKLQKTRLAEIRDSLSGTRSTTTTKQTTDAPSPIRKAVTGRSDAPIDPIKAAREEGEKTGNWKKFNTLMNERKRERLKMA